MCYNTHKLGMSWWLICFCICVFKGEERCSDGWMNMACTVTFISQSLFSKERTKSLPTW